MSLTPAQIAKDNMFAHDQFSQLLGMEIIDISEGSATVSLLVTGRMTNGFGIAHGGITYSLADSAFAFACNSLGHIAVSVETAISHMSKVASGDKITAKAKMIHRSRSLGRFEVKVTNQDGKLVADFKGTCFFTDKLHEAF